SASCASVSRRRRAPRRRLARVPTGAGSAGAPPARPRETAMGLKTPEEYVESLRDGRVTYWDGERIDDITTHPRFKVPIALTAADCEYDAPDLGALRRYRTENGDEAHRIYQIPMNEGDLATRVEMLRNTSIGT